MAGIKSYGAYIPFHRLSRAEIAKAWGGPPGQGEKAVANFDEDSVTMAVAASLDCVKGFNINDIGGVFFATTTAPYREKQSAATIAAAMGMSNNIRTVDFSNSLRGGGIALRAAIDAVDAGSCQNVLVVCADTRLGTPKGEREMAFGDGAAALLIGKSDCAVEIEGTHTVSEEIFETWRADRESIIRSWEDRFVRDTGYSSILPKTVAGALKKFNLTPQDISKAAFYAPDPRQLGAAAKKVGLDAKTQVQDTLFGSVGNTGTALSFMVLVAALEEAKEGDRILLANYGDGCDVFNLKVTKQIEKLRDRRGIKCHLESKKMLSNYMKYLLWRELVDVEAAARPKQAPVSMSASWRDRDQGLALHGSKCKRCGTPQYPVQRVCVICQAKDEFEPYAFTEHKGKIMTFSHDNLAAAIDPPSTIVTIDFDGGGRIFCDMTDRVAEEVKTGDPVELTFRKLHYVDGVHNYWWKCAPVRC